MTVPPLTLTPEAWTGFEAALRAYVRPRVDRGEADDLVGDILLRLMRHQGSLEEARHPLAWIRRVAANAIADHHRARASERRALDQARREPQAPAPTEAAGAGLTPCLMPFIRQLPDTYREALLLTDIQGLTQAAAARELGLSRSGMKSRVQRGRAKLKLALLRCCAIEVDRRGQVLDYRPRGGACRRNTSPPNGPRYQKSRGSGRLSDSGISPSSS